jgi:DNA-binding CsgD family transcriptional regulator
MLLGAAALAGAHAAMPADDVAEQARRAWGIGDLLAVEPPDSQNHWGPIHALILAGDVDRAQPAIALLLRESRRLGAGAGLAMSRLLGTLLGLRRGTLLDAEADALDAIDLAVEHFFFAVPGAVGLASEALVERGELDRAGELFERYAFPPELLPPGFGDHYLVGRGLLRLAEQRWDEALADLMAAGNRMLAWHSPGPAVVAWRSRAALAASALGDHDTATRLASEEVALAEAYGSPHTLGLALRAAGIVARPIDRIAILERAVAVLDSTPFELEAARALTDLGTQLRHHGTVARARPVLRRGLDLAVRCGATPIAERARRELIATGARPRRSAITGAAALTGTEQRISLLAAAGRSNREIAQELFVTVKTVEAHLTNSYRKLGISSRDALGTHLGLSP